MNICGTIHRRWLILAVFFCTYCTIMMLYTFKFPIAGTLSDIFGWKGSDVGKILIPELVLTALVAPFLPIVIRKRGLKEVVLTAAGLGTLSGAIVCIPANKDNYFAVAMSSQFFAAFAFTICRGTLAAVSTTWFPPSQWAFSLALLMISPTMGNFLSQLIVPHAVPNTGTFEEQYARYSHYCYALFGLMLACTAAVFIFFAATPKVPPAATAAKLRILRPGYVFKKVLTNWKFWMYAINVALLYSIMITFLDFLFLLLADYGLDQETAGAVNASSVGTVIALQFVIGYLADRIPRSLKGYIVASSLLCFEGAVWLLLIVLEVVPVTTAGVFIPAFLVVTFSSVAPPSQMQLLVETMYPVDESALSGLYAYILVILNGAMDIAIAAVGPGNWIIYYTVAATGTAAVAALMLSNNYAKSDEEYRGRRDAESQKLMTGGPISTPYGAIGDEN